MTSHTLLAVGTLAVVLVGANANGQPVFQPSTATAKASVAADVPVRALIAAMQAQDAAAIRTQFAPTATQAYGADGMMKAPAATPDGSRATSSNVRARWPNPNSR